MNRQVRRARAAIDRAYRKRVGDQIRRLGKPIVVEPKTQTTIYYNRSRDRFSVDSPKRVFEEAGLIYSEKGR